MDIKKDTYKLWANEIKLLIRASINLNSVSGIESDIDELVAIIEIKTGNRFFIVQSVTEKS